MDFEIDSRDRALHKKRRQETIMCHELPEPLRRSPIIGR